MLISVKILKGGECTIEVSASASIKVVKQLVAKQLQVPVQQQKLVFQGKTLLDGESLCDYNIVEGNKIFLFISDEVKNSSTSDLWDPLLEFLEKHFSSEDAKKVLDEFKKSFYEKINNMSLDDIERLAIMNLEAENSAKKDTS